MPKQILILKASPRERGNSATLADRLAAGASEAGAQVESIYLHSLDIRACDACDLCQEPGSGCVIEDDMQPLYPKLAGADAIVLASPDLLVHLQRPVEALHGPLVRLPVLQLAGIAE